MFSTTKKMTSLLFLLNRTTHTVIHRLIVYIIIISLCHNISLSYYVWFVGLDKLIEASEQVTELSKELAVKEKDLAIASTKAEEVLKEVTKSAAAAEKVKNQVQKVKDKAQSIVDSIDVEKKVGLNIEYYQLLRGC